MNIAYKVNRRIGWALAVTLLFSCTKNFDEINTKQDLVSRDKVKVDGMLTQVLAGSIFDTYGGLLSQFAGYHSYPDAGFPFNLADYPRFSEGIYRSYLINLSELVRLTEDKPELANKNAIAKIFRSWVWLQLTDRFGDMPFTEAVLGVDSVVFQPKYDTQEAIYTQLFSDLKSAVAQLSTNPEQVSFGPADLVFGGDTDAWKRFGNSLRLRMSLRVRFVNESLAQSNINDVIGAPLITANAQNAKLLSEAGTGNAGNYSPIINDINSGYLNGLMPSFTVMELLVKKNDPRLPVYFLPNSNGFWRARPVNLISGQENRYPYDSVNFVGNFFRTPQFSFNVITAAEVSFLEAEAMLVGLIPGDPQAQFADGIKKAMEMYNINQGDIDDYLVSPAGMLAGTEEDKLKQIIEQKYIALMYQSDEAWAEYRRTGYPLMWLGGGNTSTNGTIPRRLTYPQNEYSINKTNVEAAASKLSGGDLLTSRVWWDVKPGLPIAHPQQGSFPPETW